MGLTSISFLASFTYVVASLLQYLSSLSKITVSKLLKFRVVCSVALLLHGYLLYRWIDTPAGQNLSLSLMFSLICWIISLALLAITLIKTLENLTLFVLPVTALSILLAVWFPGHEFFQTGSDPSMLIHILISILTFGILGLAALQATLLYYQNRILRNNVATGIVRILPPLQTMERLLFQIIWFGFLLLSASLLSSTLLSYTNLFTHHPEKVILSLLAWCLFAGLLYGHYRSGLRGLTAIRWTLIGVSLLLGGYLAGKLFPIGS